MNIEIMRQVLEGSESGKLIFPEVVKTLLDAGVESYFIDFIRGEDTFYLSDGRSHIEQMTVALAPVAEDFSQPALVAAIRAAQTDTIRYPEFVKQATGAGVAGYRACLTGKRVVYIGRKGDLHVEEFPRLS